MRTPAEQASYIEHLEAQVETLKAEHSNLRVEIDRLKKEKGLTREDLSFNGHTGLYADASGKLLCPTCVGEEKRNPLKTEKYGWRCTVGSHFFSNPDADLNASAFPRGGSGPNSWMKS